MQFEMSEIFEICLNFFIIALGCIFIHLNVAGTSFMAFNFMLDSLSHMNDKDKQQVCGNFRK